MRSVLGSSPILDERPLYDGQVTDDRAARLQSVVAAAPAAVADALAANQAPWAALDDAWLRASEAWSVELPFELFAAHLGARLPANGDLTALARVAVADLMLACACVHDISGAHARLREQHLADVRRGVGRQPDPATADELVHEVFYHLLVSDHERPPRIANYSGRGPLGRWISVVARRLVLDRLRSTGRAAEIVEDEGGIAAAYGDPELAAMKQGTRDAFRAALEAAAAELRPRDRNMLRYAFVHQLGIEEIAGIYRVSRSTARRNLTAIREGLASRVRERLCDMLRVDRATLESELAELHSAVGVTLSRILKNPPRP